MTQHICPRCGQEDPCSYGSWPDRHPFLAVAGGLLGLVWMTGVFAVYPVTAWSVTGLAAAILAARNAVRRRERRAALAARADYEHAALMAQSTPAPIRLPRDPTPLRRTTAAEPWGRTVAQPLAAGGRRVR